MRLPIQGGLLRLMRVTTTDQARSIGVAARQADRVRYHLGRGRRARERGELARAIREARLALQYDTAEPWAHALLGRCLAIGHPPDLTSARHALERACSLSPTNGYFVGLLLDVLDREGDAAARDSALTRAWWAGGPVDRWIQPTGSTRRPTPAWSWGGADIARGVGAFAQPVGA